MQHLYDKLEDLQNELNVIREKLRRLRLAHAAESSVAIRFQLEQQIQQTETEIAECEQRLDQVERLGNVHNLYQTLLQLGYWQQVVTFRKFVESRAVAAFLIYGSTYEYGQQWLLNRLVQRHISNYFSGRTIRVDLNRVSQRCDVKTLWRELAKDLQLSRYSESSVIIDRVYQCWQSQHVLLIFDGINSFPQTYLQEFIENFWHPLARQSHGLSSSSSHRLFMFMLDYGGSVDDWNIPFAEDLGPTWNPEIPVKLPIIQEFSNEELLSWLRQGANDLPLHMVEAMDRTVERILRNSDEGIPEPSFAEICRLANIDWSELKDKVGLK